jgi:hypothetical protein
MAEERKSAQEKEASGLIRAICLNLAMLQVSVGQSLSS